MSATGMLSRLGAWIRDLGAADRTPGEVADTVQGFLDGTCGDHDWDYLTSVSIKDRDLDRFVRQNIDSVAERFPPTANGHYTNDEGERWLREVVAKLREMERQRIMRRGNRTAT